MHTSLYPSTRSKKQQGVMVLEKETSFVTIPRRQKGKHLVEPEIQILETSPIRKQPTAVLERLEKQIFEDALDKYSCF